MQTGVGVRTSIKLGLLGLLCLLLLAACLISTQVSYIPLATQERPIYLTALAPSPPPTGTPTLPPPTPTPTKVIPLPPMPEALELPFTSLERGIDSLYESEASGIFVITDQGEAHAIRGWSSERISELLGLLDYERFFSVLVLRGKRPELDYGVNIHHVIRSENNVIIEAVFSEPLPGYELYLQESSYYELIAIDKGQFQGEIRFILVANGIGIAETTTDFK